LNLTNRERDVLQLLAEGRSYKEMAQLLKISPRTVEFHKENLMVKTGLRTTAELARYAARHGVVAD
jgi:DNA-binding CsgD family transcriptional regulator